jgi:hypothetical protein
MLNVGVRSEYDGEWNRIISVPNPCEVGQLCTAAELLLPCSLKTFAAHLKLGVCKWPIGGIPRDLYGYARLHGLRLSH